MNSLVILNQDVKINGTRDFRSNDSEHIDNEKVSFNELLQLPQNSNNINDSDSKTDNLFSIESMKNKTNKKQNLTKENPEAELLLALYQQFSLIPSGQKNPSLQQFAGTALSSLPEELLSFASKQINNLSLSETLENIDLPNIFIKTLANIYDKTESESGNLLLNFKLKLEQNDGLLKNEQISKQISSLLSEIKDRISITNPNSVTTDELDSHAIQLGKLDLIGKNTFFTNKKAVSDTNNYLGLYANQIRNSDKLSLSSSNIFHSTDIVSHVIEQIDWDSKFDTAANKALESNFNENEVQVSQDIRASINNTNDLKNSQLTDNASQVVSRFTLKENIYSPLWGNEISKNISNLLSNGLRKAELRLTPAELGTINIELHVNNKNLVNIYVVTPNNTIRTLFESSIANLKQSLSEEGFSLENSFVETNDNSGGNFADNDSFRRSVLNLDNSDNVDNQTTSLELNLESQKNLSSTSSGIDTFV